MHVTVELYSILAFCCSLVQITHSFTSTDDQKCEATCTVLCRERARFNVQKLSKHLVCALGLDVDVIMDTAMGLGDSPAFLESEGLIDKAHPYKPSLDIHSNHSGGLHHFENLVIHSSEVNSICHGDNFKTVTFMSNSEIFKHLSENWQASLYHIKVMEEGDELDLVYR